LFLEAKKRIETILDLQNELQKIEKRNSKQRFGAKCPSSSENVRQRILLAPNKCTFAGCKCGRATKTEEQLKKT